jgi:hypothetical protein
VLFARYDLGTARGLSPRDLNGGTWTTWRYRELMPVRDEANIVTLGEGMTPLLRASRLGRAYGFEPSLMWRACSSSMCGKFAVKPFCVMPMWKQFEKAEL